MDIKKIYLEGDFGYYKGKLYRTLSYWNDVELFAEEDLEKKQVLYRVSKDDMEEMYTLYTSCRIKGINYVVRKMEGEIVTYERLVCDHELFQKPLNEVDVIIRVKNRSNQEPERTILYMNPEITEDRVLKISFVPEEMHNGDIMLSFLDEELDVAATIQGLQELYGKRLEIHSPNEKLLMIDYYVAKIMIDENEFCLDYDWGIVTISPRAHSGNDYIWEITNYFNSKFATTTS